MSKWQRAQQRKSNSTCALYAQLHCIRVVFTDQWYWQQLSNIIYYLFCFPLGSLQKAFCLFGSFNNIDRPSLVCRRKVSSVNERQLKTIRQMSFAQIFLLCLLLGDLRIIFTFKIMILFVKRTLEHSSVRCRLCPIFI